MEETLKKILTRTALFEGIGAQDLTGLLDCLGACRQSFPKDSMVLSAGDEAKRMGITLSGCLQILREEYTGERSIVALLGPGELFAEAYACAPERAGGGTLPISVYSAETSEVLWMDAKRMAAPCANACAYHHRLIENMLGVLASKNLLLSRKIGLLSKRTTREKILSYLSEESARQGGGVFRIPFCHQELADYLCVERSGLSAALSSLRKEGVIRYDRNRFELCTPSAEQPHVEKDRIS